MSAAVIQLPEDVLSSPMPTTPGLAVKLARVMDGVSRVRKSGFNQHHQYKFATDADVSDEVRSLLASEGVAFLPSMDSIEDIRAGEKLRLVRASFTMRFVDGATGEVLACKWFSEAMDSQDKAINKAATAAVKYFLLKTFLISTGEENDPDAGPGPQRQRPPEQPRPSSRAEQAKQALKPANTDAPPPAPEEIHVAGRRIRDAASVDELVATGKWIAGLGFSAEDKKKLNELYAAKRRALDSKGPPPEPGSNG